MTDETLRDVGALLRLFLFLIGGIILLIGLIQWNVWNTFLVLGLGILATAVVWWIVDTQPPTSKITDGKMRCPHCGAEVEVFMAPEPVSFRKAGVTCVCPRCGQRI